MQVLKNVGASLVLGVIVAACGGGNAPTQAPGATPAAGNGGNGAATQQPTGTGNPGGNGGNGGVGFEFGKVKFTVDGPVKASGELGFIPAASAFGGAQGSALSFGTADNAGSDATLVSIVIGADGAVIVSYAGPAGQVPAATCTTSEWNVGATSASGKFDCTAALSLMPSGATAAGGTIKGDFTARS